MNFLSRWHKLNLKYTKIVNDYPLKTIKDLISVANVLHREKIAFKEIDNKNIKAITYSQFVDDWKSLGTALFSLNLEKKHLAILGDNSYKYVLSFLTVSCMATVCPLDKDLTVNELNDLIIKCDCEAIFVCRNYLSTAREIKNLNPNIKYIFVFDKIEDANKDYELDFDYLISLGKELIDKNDRSFIDRTIDENDLASIVFTSGTTGANKGVMLSHKNICANIISSVISAPFEGPTLSVLPLSHALEMNCDIFPLIYCGYEIYFNNSLKRLFQNIQTLKPKMMMVVPMFIDVFYHNIWNNIKKSKREVQVKFALIISKIALFFGLDIRRKLFKKIHESFGGQLRLFICGAAPLNEVSIKGLYDFGFYTVQGYGITECSPLVAVNQRFNKNARSVGKPVSGVSIKIDKPDEFGNGEVLVKGECCFSGYYKDDDASKCVIKNGWVYTGDYGRFDKKGRLCLAGRKKNLIISANGKNIFPEEIEGIIQKELNYAFESIFYSDCKIINGENKEFNCLHIVLKDDCELLKLQDKTIKETIKLDLQRVNKSLASYKRIDMFYYSKTPFIKNSYKKIVRNKMEKVEFSLLEKV